MPWYGLVYQSHCFVCGFDVWLCATKSLRWAIKWVYSRPMGNGRTLPTGSNYAYHRSLDHSDSDSLSYQLRTHHVHHTDD